NVGPCTGIAARSRGPSWSFWKTSTGTVKLPAASTTTVSGCPVMPGCQASFTFAPGGKSWPTACGTNPGGPIGGLSTRLGARTWSGALALSSAGSASDVAETVPVATVLTAASGDSVTRTVTGACPGFMVPMAQSTTGVEHGTGE